MATAKMATYVHDFGISSNKLVFDDTSDENKAYAKTFWQSVQLLPPMESRLVSSHMDQRLKVAPLGHQTANVTNRGIEEPPQLKDFFIRTGALEAADESARIKKYASIKEYNQKLFALQRQRRIEKESIVKIVRTRNKSPGKKIVQSDTEDVLKDIDEFEEKLGLKDE